METLVVGTCSGVGAGWDGLVCETVSRESPNKLGSNFSSSAFI